MKDNDTKVGATVASLLICLAVLPWPVTWLVNHVNLGVYNFAFHSTIFVVCVFTWALLSIWLNDHV